MAQILVQVSDQLLSALERVAPARTRKRSRFIQLAVQRALMELEDRSTREAYRRQPDDEPTWFDASGWSEWDPPAAARAPSKRRSRRRQ